MGCRTSQAKSAVITAKAFPTLTTDAIPSRTSPFGALNHAEMNNQDKKEEKPNLLGALSTLASNKPKD